MTRLFITLLVCMLPCLPLAPTLRAAEGKATALWVAESSHVEPGGILQTVVELRVEQGWHVYWINPGEAGMPTSVKWATQKGPECGELQHPWPKPFATGDLKGYGHEGLVRYPVTVTVPPDFEGTVTLRGELNWLACNDDSCLPGSAELVLTLTAGPRKPGPYAETIRQAFDKRAVPAGKGLALTVRDDGDHWLLEVLGESKNQLHGAHTLIATKEFAASGGFIRFEEASGGRTLARVPKSEYAPATPRELELWFLREAAEAPRILRWEAQS